MRFGAAFLPVLGVGSKIFEILEVQVAHGLK
jgi:hypothetical protein